MTSKRHSYREVTARGFSKRKLIVDYSEAGAFYSSHESTIEYLTGPNSFSGSGDASILLTNNAVCVITDSRYVHSDSHINGVDYHVLTKNRSKLSILNAIITDVSVKKIAIDPYTTSVSEWLLLKKLGCKIVQKENIIGQLRERKDSGELELIKKACHINDQAFAELLSVIKEGMVEAEIAHLLERIMRESFHVEPAFTPIVAFGEHASLAHFDSTQGKKKLGKSNEIMLVDCGVRYRNYCSDMTRMIIWKDIDVGIARALTDLTRVQRATCNRISFENKWDTIDTYARDSLQALGYPPYLHSTGHGVGIDIHEEPRVSATSRAEIKEGQVITIEPGIYEPGKWGMRIEDAIMIDSGGHPQTLTRTPIEPVVLGREQPGL